MNTKIFNTSESIRKQSFEWRKSGLKVGFVPTMGFLHEGHLNLIESAKKKCDKIILSIFVNPAQFGEGEDFEDYPRDLERDVSLASEKGTDAVFFPSAEEMYPENYQTFVNLENLPNHLCGLTRKGHFKGVATIVTKLFNIIDPDFAFFGEKDFQQLTIIKQMAKDLNFRTHIVGVPIVREVDGLAMSSRNVYLSEDQRKNALLIRKNLLLAEKMIFDGEKDPLVITDTIISGILEYEEAKIDYVKVCDLETLEDLEKVETPVLVAAAVYIGKTRLIDNIVIRSS
ncbi:MAG: pantoate--beta-alanine ligase [Deltaproteobacteria bacterium]|nr:MAG: pantoate--beta-alanine ligase [Deltaproteobacteria bacterium]